MEDLRQAKEYAKYIESLGWKVEEGVFVKKLPLFPYGFIKYQRPSWPIEFEKVDKLVKKYRVIQIKIEPNVLQDKKEVEKEFIRQGYKRDKSAMLPTKTIWLDLRKSEEQLLKEMHAKTRYNIRKNQGLKIEAVRGDRVKDELLREFYAIYKDNAKKQKFWGLRFKQLKSLLEALGKKGYLLWVKDLGGLILLVHDKTVYYSHNGVNDEGRKRFVASLLVWEAMRLGKKLGCERFDFEGIMNKKFKVTKKWAGFSRFKRSFGGKEVEYIGCFSKLNKEGLWERK
jgi:lipid II:glycine glycyltransferase (peptidoglycan interpeptide bridge formation enzyme)